jgi:hypothetical protein
MYTRTIVENIIMSDFGPRAELQDQHPSKTSKHKHECYAHTDKSRDAEDIYCFEILFALSLIRNRLSAVKCI